MRLFLLTLCAICLFFQAACVTDEYGDPTSTIVDYTLYFVDRAETDRLLSFDDTTEVISGTVTLIQKGEEITKEVENKNFVTFSGLSLGQATFTVKFKGYSTVTATVSLEGDDFREEEKRYSFSNSFPLFPSSGTTISGLVEIETDLSSTSLLKEPLPNNTSFMSVSLDTNDSLFMKTYFPSSLAGNSGIINTFYHNATQVVKTTGIRDEEIANGSYSIFLPASVEGLRYKIEFFDLNFQQILETSTVSTSESKLFSPNNSDFLINSKNILYSTEGYSVTLRYNENKVLNIFYGEGI